jgi:glycosyltransferase involved in cell wall biosynthesis
MGRFIRGTIRSVLNQDYRNVQYIVMDGASSDGTIRLLESFRGRLTYESAPDNGAADALRRGFARANGEILAYLNADDQYLPGAIAAAVREFETNPEADVVYGEGSWVDRHGGHLGHYPTREFDADALVRECFLCQPAVFFRRSAYEAVGGIDARLEYTYDYDLWLRMAREFSFVYLKQLLAKSRMYPENKTLGSRRRVFREAIRTVLANTGYAGFGHVYAYACHLVDGRDQFFAPLRPSMLKFALALGMGCALNGPFCRRFWEEASDSVRILRPAAPEAELSTFR